MSTTIVAGSSLRVLEALDREIADLIDRRAANMRQVVDELAWMDVKTLRLDRFDDDSSISSAPAGTRVHVVHQYEELGSFSRRLVHSAEDCAGVWYCSATPDTTVKGGGPTRWRYRCEGAFQVVGRDGGALVLAEETDK